MDDGSILDEVKEAGELVAAAGEAVSRPFEAGIDAGTAEAEAGIGFVSDVWTDLGNAGQEIVQAGEDAWGGGEEEADESLPARSSPARFPY